MGLAFPLGLLAALLAGPLVLLYVLKLRRREVIVASTLPWRRVLEDRRASSPWERLRRHLLLLLQLIILLLLVLAFAGPFRRAETALAGDTVLVLDVSASMGAAGPDGSRMDEAKARVREALLSVEGGRRAALVLAGAEPRVAAPLMPERAPLMAALSAARATEAPADLGAALQLVESLARGQSGGEVMLFTDGSFDPAPAAAAALASGVRVVRVGGDEPPGNAGITSLALRPVAGEAGVHELFVGLHSHGRGELPVSLVVQSAAPQAESDPAGWAWAAVASESVVPGPDSTASQLVRVAAPDGTAIRVRLTGGDGLSADDEALLIVPSRPPRRILLASPTPFLLQRALQAIPAVEVDLVDGEPGSGAGYDAVVIDGPLPEVLPQRPLLAFGRPPDATGTWEEPRVLRWQSRHPALRHARFDAVRVASAHDAPLPPGADVLVESDRGPLAVTWPAPGGRALAFRFDLTASDLPLRVTFPVLVADAVDWLTEGMEQDGVLPTGSGREVPLAGATSAMIVLPGEEPRDLRVQAGALQLPPSSAAGIALLQPEGVPQRLLAFSLLSPEETDLSARGLRGVTEEDAAGPAGEIARVPGRRHLWPLAAALAIGVLLAEWAVYHRRRE